jgi:Rieske Fe-S protein
MDHHDAERTDEHPEGATEPMEDFLRLEAHLARLQANRRPRRPPRLPLDQMRLYQTAALFRAAAPGAAAPDPTFAARLYARVEREWGHRRPMAGGQGSDQARAVSRRMLLAGGVTAAAAAAAGVVAGVGLDRTEQGPLLATLTSGKVELVPNGVWVALFLAAGLPVGSVRRFATEQVVGFVRYTAAGFEALSGACTHMGCLVAWNSTTRTFDCPCHGGRFLESGQVAAASPVVYRSLPAIKSRVQDGQVWVYLPPSHVNLSTFDPDPPVNAYR